MNILIVAFAQNFRADSKNIEIENKVANFIKDKSNNSACFFLAETRYGEEPEKGTYAWQPWSRLATYLQNFQFICSQGIEWDCPYYINDFYKSKTNEPIEQIIITGNLTPIEYIKLGSLLQSYFLNIPIKFTDFYQVAPTETLKQMNIEIEK